MRTLMLGLLMVGLTAAPASAQLGRIGRAIGKANEVKGLADQVKDFVITDKEEQDLGATISAQLRAKYGVVQNAAVHKYVSLVGTVLAEASSRPKLPWTFVVLDTDGVNAFAAPGGYVHITRGALALIDTEAELAGVLGHEITHITEKHTINAIKKSKVVGGVTEAASRSDVLSYFTDRAYENLLENKYDRNDENESDQVGIRLANEVGYAPSGLGTFLTALAARNADLKEPSGVFASHPETKSRLSRLTKQITSEKLGSTAMVKARYDASITYKPVPVTAVPLVDPLATDPKAAEAKAPESKSRFGLGGMTSKLGGDKTNTGTVASAGSRGVNPDRDAKGGSNANPVRVTLTPAEIAAFRNGITG